VTGVLHTRTFKEAIASLLLLGIVAALFRAEDRICVASLMAVLMACIFGPVWLWRAAGAFGGGKEEFLRRDSLSLWQATDCLTTGGWVCSACGRLNPADRHVCHLCSARRPGSSADKPPRRETTGAFTPRSSADPGLRGRAVMEELARPHSWTYERLRKVFIASAIYDEDIPGSCAPETIDLGRLARHIKELTAKAAFDGNEWSRVFLVDVGKKALLQGKTTRGDRCSVLSDWSTEPGRERMQKRSFCVHTHPMATQSIPQGFSDGDYQGLLCDRQQRAIIMVCGGSVMMVLQTSSTPRVASPKGLERRLDMIEREARKGARTPGSADWIIDFNKQVCLQFGLCLYIGGEDGRMKRVRVV
jgi:hypothetical protein